MGRTHAKWSIICCPAQMHCRALVCSFSLSSPAPFPPKNGQVMTPPVAREQVVLVPLPPPCLKPPASSPTDWGNRTARRHPHQQTSVLTPSSCVALPISKDTRELQSVKSS